LPDEIELVAVNLPGRGRRSNEPPATRVQSLLAELCPALQERRTSSFAFFGHSMGALVAFELCRWLRRTGLEQPRHVFLAGFPEPGTIADGRGRPVEQLSDDQLVSRLQKLNGIPAEILAEPGLLEALLPTFRADIELVQHYDYRPEPPLAVPISAFGGTQDQVGSLAIRRWRNHTTAAFQARFFEGGHFFVQPHLATIAVSIGKGLGAT
jgi:medium-chain acyl-[acyl-carrier-protein] hydrolase